MDIAAMDGVLVKEMQKPPHVVELGGLVTDCLRVECDREHPVWVNHGECNGGEFSAPFGLLKPLRVYGETPRKALPTPFPAAGQPIVLP